MKCLPESLFSPRPVSSLQSKAVLRVLICLYFGVLAQASYCNQVIPHLGQTRAEIEAICGQPTTGPIILADYIKATSGDLELEALNAAEESEDEKLVEQAYNALSALETSTWLTPQNPLAIFSSRLAINEFQQSNANTVILQGIAAGFLNSQDGNVLLTVYELGDYNIAVAYLKGRAATILYARARPAPTLSTSGGLLPRKSISETPPIADETVLSFLSANAGASEWQVPAHVVQSAKLLFPPDLAAYIESGGAYLWTSADADRSAAWDGGLFFGVSLRKPDASNRPQSSRSPHTSPVGEQPSRLPDQSSTNEATVYRAKISHKDLRNSKGIYLPDVDNIQARDILLQDRFNYHQSGVRDPEDTHEGVYKEGTQALRQLFESKVARLPGGGDPLALLRSEPVVEVTVTESEIIVSPIDSSGDQTRLKSGRSNAVAAPTAFPVPGKPGFVTSPFDPDGRFVDVRGLPSGTEVEDPYTNEVFSVP